jgi:hypothetical protein
MARALRMLGFMYIRIQGFLLISLLCGASTGCDVTSPVPETTPDGPYPTTRPDFPEHADTTGAWVLARDARMSVVLDADQEGMGGNVETSVPGDGGTVTLPSGHRFAIECGGDYLCPAEIIDVDEDGTWRLYALNEALVAVDLTAQRNWCDDPASPLPPGAPSMFSAPESARTGTFLDYDGTHFFQMGFNPQLLSCFKPHNCFARPTVEVTVLEYETLPDGTKRATELSVDASVFMPTRCLESDFPWDAKNNSGGFTVIGTRFTARRPAR